MILVNHKIRTELIGEASTFNVVCNIIKISYLGPFVKLRKATVISIMSVCLSFCQHGTTRLQLEELS
jgi:hypothetical protein